MEEKEISVSLSELENQARAAIARKDKLCPEKVKAVSNPILPVEELPVIEKSKGGGHLKSEKTDDLNTKDLDILAMLALGADKTTVAALMNIDRKTIYRLLDSDRVERLTKGARKLLSSLAPLAVEIVHAELVKGNVEVAQAVLKGLNIMRQSVNSGEAKLKVSTVAEEIVDNDGKTTKRIIRSREEND